MVSKRIYSCHICGNTDIDNETITFLYWPGSETKDKETFIACYPCWDKLYQLWYKYLEETPGSLLKIDIDILRFFILTGR